MLGAEASGEYEISLLHCFLPQQIEEELEKWLSW